MAKEFLFGIILGLAIGWLFFTPEGKLLLGWTKEKIRAELEERLKKI